MLQDRWPLVPGLEIWDLHGTALGFEHMIPLKFGYRSILLGVVFTATYD